MNRAQSLGFFLLAVCALVVVVAGIALANELPPGGTFIDDDGNIHEGNIEAIAAGGITRGCNPPANTLYCPASTVTRGQMAAFIRRALDVPYSTTDHFVDDEDSIFESDIDAIASAGITRGCNPPDNDRFCPDSGVTRGQMAAFIVRAFGYTESGAGDLFSDDDGSVFEADIDRLGTAGVTKGCNPPANDRFCPTAPVLRDQMASFFARALGLDPIVVPPPRVPVFATAWGGTGSDPHQFDGPRGIDIAPDGTVYVADSENSRVQVFSPTGVLLDSWERPGFPPWAVAVAPNGSVYVTGGQYDPWKREIYHYTPDGTLIGSFGTKYAPSPGYWRLDVAPDGSVYALAFRHLDAVVHFTADGQFINWWGDIGPGEENFRGSGLAVSSDGSVYVSSLASAAQVGGGGIEDEARVLRFTPDGTFIDSFQLRNASGPTGEITANGIGIGSDDTLYVIDSSGRIQRFTADGEFLGAWGTPGIDEGEFSGLVDVAAGSDAVYTLEQDAVFTTEHEDVNRVQKFVYP